MNSICIVTAVYNGAATLQGYFSSIRAQSDPVDQLILIDGKSTDGSVDIIRANADIVSYWESSADKGIYDAWNKALPHIDADWVWFVGCDDEFATPSTIAQIRRHLAGIGPETGLVYAKVVMVSAGGVESEVVGEPWDQAKRKAGFRMPIPHTALLARAQLFAGDGRFDPSYRIAGDYEWFRRVSPKTGLQFIDAIVIRSGDAGLSSATRTQVLTALEFGRILDAAHVAKPIGWYWLLCTCWVKMWLMRLFGPRLQGVAVNLYRVMTGRKPRATGR